MSGQPSGLHTALATSAALAAFAGNSVLCRLALSEPSIDAASFSTIRVAAGAVTLVLVVRSPGRPRRSASTVSAAMLALYAIAFSFAYLSLPTGTGALILFAAVQATMVLAALLSGERPRALQWIGLATAIAGLVYLVLPGLEAPSPVGSSLMALAGIAWGVYSLRGRTVTDAAVATRDNFLLAVPAALLVSLVTLPALRLSLEGALLAASSGALTSGLGYVIWYRALPGLSATVAASVQLAVPVLAAVAGVALLAEPVTTRLVVASILILGGIALSIRGATVRSATRS